MNSLARKIKEEPPTYEAITDVPERYQTLNGARLSLVQIHEIMGDAYDNSKDTSIDVASARKRFSQKNEIIEGFWVPLKPKTGDSK